MCPCLPVESLLLHIDFLRIDCVHDLQNQLLAIIIVTIIIIIPITNHANTHHRNGFCVMPLWDSMKCVKSQNQLLFHTMIKLTDSFMCVLHWKSKNNVFVHVHVLSFIYPLRMLNLCLSIFVYIFPFVFVFLFVLFLYPNICILSAQTYMIHDFARKIYWYTQSVLTLNPIFLYIIVFYMCFYVFNCV